MIIHYELSLSSSIVNMGNCNHFILLSFYNIFYFYAIVIIYLLLILYKYFKRNNKTQLMCIVLIIDPKSHTHPYIYK